MIIGRIKLNRLEVKVLSFQMLELKIQFELGDTRVLYFKEKIRSLYKALEHLKQIRYKTSDERYIVTK